MFKVEKNNKKCALMKFIVEMAFLRLWELAKAISFYMEERKHKYFASRHVMTHLLGSQG
jgi:hypothetical protein